VSACREAGVVTGVADGRQGLNVAFLEHVLGLAVVLHDARTPTKAGARLLPYHYPVLRESPRAGPELADVCIRQLSYRTANDRRASRPPSASGFAPSAPRFAGPPVAAFAERLTTADRTAHPRLPRAFCRRTAMHGRDARSARVRQTCRAKTARDRARIADAAGARVVRRTRTGLRDRSRSWPLSSAPAAPAGHHGYLRTSKGRFA
jgi:hypothetical protein